MKIHWKRKKVIRHIIEDLENSDEYDEEQFYFNKHLKSFYKHENFAFVNFFLF